MSAIKEIMRLDPNKYIIPLGVNETQFGHKDLIYLQADHGPTGISCEEFELLYSLIRITRPEFVLETGTNIGVSASAICLALRDNGFGHLTTIEYSPYVADIARRKLNEMQFTNFEIFTGSVRDYKEPDKIDFLFLDTELNIRYGELVRFYPKVKPGGLILIHDLPGLDHEGFGGVPVAMQTWLKKGDLRALVFPTIHGISVFQKRTEKDWLADQFRQ